MKYIQLGIMAVLVFGISASPILNSEFAFAHHLRDPSCNPEDSENREDGCYDEPQYEKQASIHECYLEDPQNPVPISSECIAPNQPAPNPPRQE